MKINSIFYLRKFLKKKLFSNFVIIVHVQI